GPDEKLPDDSLVTLIYRVESLKCSFYLAFLPLIHQRVCIPNCVAHSLEKLGGLEKSVKLAVRPAGFFQSGWSYLCNLGYTPSKEELTPEGRKAGKYQDLEFFRVDVGDIGKTSAQIGHDLLAVEQADHLIGVFIIQGFAVDQQAYLDRNRVLMHRVK